MVVTLLLYASVLTSLYLQGFAFAVDNTPPVFNFDRQWLIQENEPVGSRITIVRTRDEEGDSIEYGIDPSVYVDGSQYFSINKDSGEVLLAKSLAGQGGNDFYLYITANDGHQTAKIEVYVRVLEPNLSPNPEPGGLDVPFSTSRPPSFGSPEDRHPGGGSRRGRPFPGRHPFLSAGPPAAHPPSPNSGRAPAPPAVFAPSDITAPSPSAAVPGDQPPVRQIPQGEGGGQANHNEKTTTTGQRGNEGANGGQGVAAGVTSAVLPALIVTGLAPALMLGLWLLYRRCKHHEKLRTLKKAVSAARIEGGLSNTVAFSYSPSALLRPSASILSSNSTQASLSHQNSAVLTRDAKWEFPRHQLHFLGILGEGCFGQVWKCETTSTDRTKEPEIVAVKTLRENATEKEKKDLVAELDIMKLLDPHPNVVTLLGCCTEREPILVIMEYVAGGKLQAFLRESRAERQYGNLHGSNKRLTSQDLTSFSYQVARGMDYLATKGIIHRDLAARNILVSENKICKVADFGFARDVLTSHVYERKSEGRLPIRWMAPESLFDNIYTTKTDVWSFGVLLWEIVTLGSTPYPGLSASEVMKRVREGYRLEKPEHCRREMYNIMFYCWEKDPAQRPTFSELVSLLDRLLISEHTYIELERFPDHSYYNITDLSGEKL